MPQYNRSSTSYRNLPDELATNKLSDARLTASLTVVVPKEISKKKVDRFLADAHKELEDGFQKFMKKELKKLKEESSDG